MSELLNKIDSRTKLAGSNAFEILCFNSVKDEIYGLNVFKVREVIHIPTINSIPGAQKGVIGMSSIRGDIVPIIDLNIIFNNTPTEDASLLILTEFSGSTQALLAKSVDTIRRIDWDKVIPASSIIGESDIPLTSIIKLEDDTLISIIDVEQIISKINGGIPTIEKVDKQLQGTIFFADDSFVARKHLSEIFDKFGVAYKSASNGEDAWNALQSLISDGAELKTKIDIVMTDIEMPKMDGYVLTQKIKSHALMQGIPVIMYSSLTNDTNERRGREVGADGYISKFQADEIAGVLTKYLKGGAK